MNAKDYDKLSDSDKKKEDWMNSKWRPMMGWMYMAVCTFDFIVAPVLWSLVQALFKGGVNVQWQPLTLQGAGLFHIAMGAVLGLAAYGRTQEKLNGANNGGIQLPANVGTTYTPPAPMGQPAGGCGAPSQTTVTQTFGSPAPSGGFGGFGGFGGQQSSGGFGQVTTGFGGKPAPIQPPDPVL